MTMAKQETITPAAFNALLNGDIENFIVGSTPSGIEAQEKLGQTTLVNGSFLPKECSPEDKVLLEDQGVIFGEDKDDLFVNVTLPAGWKKVATDHDMWSHLCDADGNIKAELFYKAAFYDKRARMHVPVSSNP